MKRCKSTSVLSGLRCCRSAGHRGEHRSDPIERADLVEKLAREAFGPSRKKRKKHGTASGTQSER